MKQITINCDASLSLEYGVGGWAFWAHDGLSVDIKQSGAFKCVIGSPKEAELLCVLNAIALVHRLRDLSQYEVLIRTDNVGVIQLLTGMDDPYFGPQVAYILKILGKAKKYSLVHVKAHTHGKDQASLYNHWCDRHARKAMRILLKEVKKREEDNARRKPVNKRKPRKANKLGQVVTDRRMGSRGIVPYRRTKRNFY